MNMEVKIGIDTAKTLANQIKRQINKRFGTRKFLVFLIGQRVRMYASNSDLKQAFMMQSG